MFFKRGLSNIVATVLIVLLSLVAISVVWAFLSPVFESSGLQTRANTLCINAEVKPIKCEYNASGTGFNLKSAVLKHDSGEVQKMKAVLVYKDGETKSAEFDSGGLYSSREFALPNLLGVSHTKEPERLEGWAIVRVDNRELVTCTQLSNKIGCLKVVSEGQVSSPSCGNGRVEGSEGCDDGNLNSGDGCNSTCGVEIGWNCQVTQGGQGVSSCNTICGDNIIIHGYEVCDGTNLNNQNCTSLGFLLGGVLGCNSSCTGFNTTRCYGCSGVTQCSNYTIHGQQACLTNTCSVGGGCFWGALQGRSPTCNSCVGITQCSGYTDYGRDVCTGNPCGLSQSCDWRSGSCQTLSPI